MKTILIIFISLIFTNINLGKNPNDDAQETKHPVGLGIRVGDFNGISAQYFLTQYKMSLGFDVGRSYFFADNYEKRFDEYAEANGLDYVTYDNKGTNEGASYGFKFNICKYTNVSKIPHLYAYGGIGFQARRFFLSHEYTIKKTAANSPLVKLDAQNIYNIPHQSYGIDFIAGSEYVFQDFPAAVFVDFSLFIEAYEITSQIMGQMGLGVRVHF